MAASSKVRAMLLGCGAMLCCLLGEASAAAGEFRAGASAVDISPRVLPAISNGGFLEATRDRVDDPLFARTLVLSEDRTTLAIVVVDSCMLPRAVCDEIKAGVASRVPIPRERILIAATHTHSAPSLMDYCLGCRQDPHYAQSFIPRVVEGIVQAHDRLQPAACGWIALDAPNHTHSRRWLYRPEAYAADPFGETTVRAMMHPGYENPAFTGPAGPVDSGLTVLSVRTRAGEPLAVLANYSMHYFGSGGGFSADYFGDFARFVQRELVPRAAPGGGPIAVMSQGTSGDQHWMDYGRPKRADYTRQQYAAELGRLVVDALGSLEHRTEITLEMAERRLELRRRLPSAARLRWAEEVRSRQNNPVPASQPEVYAQQAFWLKDNPRAELVLQAVRIGELGLTAIPNEVFGITGLKLKAQSPLTPLANLELANGAEGYIPPPEQHLLGGYTTWPARTAGLEVDAEPKIVAALLELLEIVAGGAKRRPLSDDFYNEQQRAAIERARRDDNNRQNRGLAP